MFSRETVTALVVDSVERLWPMTVTAHLPVLIERFARQRLHAVARSEGLLPETRPLVLFVCTQNAARSQMAAALARHVSEGRVDVMSAGSDPASAINRAVVDAIAEIGIELVFEFPKPLTDDVVRAADVVVTMGCGDVCPSWTGRATWTGMSPTLPAKTSTPCARFATRSPTMSSICSRSSSRDKP